MRKYLFHGRYTPDGYKGLLQEGGTVRIDAAKQALGSVGGFLEAFYYSCDEEDFYIIVNLPDYVSAMAVTLAGNVSATFSILTFSGYTVMLMVHVPPPKPVFETLAVMSTTV